MFGCWVYSFSKSTQLPVVTDQEWGLHHERVCKVWAGCRMQDAGCLGCVLSHFDAHGQK